MFYNRRIDRQNQWYYHMSYIYLLNITIKMRVTRIGINACSCHEQYVVDSSLHILGLRTQILVNHMYRIIQADPDIRDLNKDLVDNSGRGHLENIKYGPFSTTINPRICSMHIGETWLDNTINITNFAHCINIIDIHQHNTNIIFNVLWIYVMMNEVSCATCHGPLSWYEIK